MNEKEKTMALFRLSVLGPLTCRGTLAHGELHKIIQELSRLHYVIPDSQQTHLSAKTIERWYYLWLRGGFEALCPKQRSDAGKCHLDTVLQETILTLKKANPSRSLNTLRYLLIEQGLIAKEELSRASLHRFLQRHQLSQRVVSEAETIERRRFEAAHAGDIWYGDVLHGPRIMTPKGKRKVYLVSLMDDASRLITHSAFCFGETALDIEGVLKQALLKRGIPQKFIIDNGPAYRAQSLQMICARLEIQLIYCRPYEPEGKGKLERWHRTFRDQFLTECPIETLKDIYELNARLWAWIEQVYHATPHSSLTDQITPIDRWRQDLIHVRPLGQYARSIDDYFYHRVKRTVKKDGTLTWKGKTFEVPYQCAQQTLYLVVDPHLEKAIKVESLAGKALGAAHPLNTLSNCHRKRQRPLPQKKIIKNNETNVVDLAYQRYQQQALIVVPPNKKEEK